MRKAAWRRTATGSGRLILSWAALAWERLWPALWPAVGVSGLFLLLALLDLLPALPGWLHAIVLVLLAAGIVEGLRRGLRGLHLPDRKAALRRLERVNALRHRPLQTLEDRLPGGRPADPAARALWAEHQARMRAAVAKLRVGAPSPKLYRHDPFALRLMLGLGLFLAVLLAGEDAANRLSRALMPQIALWQPAPPAVLDAWIAPPEHTGEPPRFLAATPAGETTLLTVPQGSRLVARVSGGRGTPVLAIAPSGENEGPAREIPFAAVPGPSGDSHRLEQPLETGGTVTVQQGRTVLAGWHIEIQPDTAPSIAFAKPPSQTRNAVLRLDFRATDDHGIEHATAQIRRLDESQTAAGEPMTVDLPLGSNRRRLTGTSYHDLTPHPWAGLPVEIVLSATDSIGQEGRSEAVRTVLPERLFNHPVAREIVAERRRLSANPAANALEVGLALRIIAWQPERYNEDHVVFLALTSTAHRLDRDRGIRTGDPEVLAGVQQVLWETALRVEDGKLSLSANALRQAEQALRDALKNDAEDAEIERLLDQLEAAMNEYLDELARMQPDGQQMQPARPDPRATVLRREDLRRMLDRIRELNRSGAREAAQQMLAQMQSMMENLRTQQRMAGPNGENQRAMQALRDLQKLIEGQQELLDETFRDSQDEAAGQPMPGMPGQGQQGQQGRGQPSQQSMDRATRQEQLRRQLGDVMRRLGEMSGNIPRPMGRAEGEMRRSGEALQQGQTGQSVDAQTRAVDQLQQGARSATDELMRMLGQGEGMEQTGPDGSPLPRDPLGRLPPEAGDGLSTGDVGLPEGEGLRQAREIRDELRRRASDPSRPASERQYIDRLLRQF
ncbi:MAG: TIGR02302 family protein [Alphaproteobacteria bacterium]